MTADLAAEQCRMAIFQALILASPILLVAFAVSLFIGLLQAVTQLHDQALSFIPRLVVMAVVMLLLMPWGLERLMEYATDLIHNIPHVVSSVQG